MSAAATTAEIAALDFEPMSLGPETMPPTNVRWAELANPYCITMRMAWLIVQNQAGDDRAHKRNLG